MAGFSGMSSRQLATPMRGYRPRFGFTLIEMLVVMVLLGLMTGLTLPVMQRWHDGVQTRAKMTSVVEALRAAGFAAAATRRDLRLDRSSFALADGARQEKTPQGLADTVKVPLPMGWSVQNVLPAYFLATGLCVPGGIDFITDSGDRTSVLVVGPICAIETHSRPTGLHSQ